MAPSCSTTESFELFVVGGGHAGCEAALTAPVAGEAGLYLQGDGAVEIIGWWGGDSNAVILHHCSTVQALACRSGQGPGMDRNRRPIALHHGADLK